MQFTIVKLKFTIVNLLSYTCKVDMLLFNMFTCVKLRLKFYIQTLHSRFPSLGPFCNSITIHTEREREPESVCVCENESQRERERDRERARVTKREGGCG